MFCKRRLPISETPRPATDRKSQFAQASGRAMSEVLLIAAIPLLCWISFSVMGTELQSPWQAAKTPASYGPSRAVRDFIDLKDGTFLAIHRNGELAIWDANAKSMIADFRSELDETRVGAFASRKRILVVGSTKGLLEVWDLNNQQDTPRKFEADEIAIRQCEFTADENVLITAGSSGQLKFWNTSTWTLIRVLQMPGACSIHSMLRSSDEKSIFAGTCDGHVHKWSLTDFSLEQSFNVSNASSPNTIVNGIFEIPGEQHLAVTTRGGEVTVLNHATGDLVRRCDAPLESLVSATVIQGGEYLVGVNSDGVSRTWNLISGQQFDMASFASKSMQMLALASDGQSLIGGDCEGAIEFLSLDNLPR